MPSKFLTFLKSSKQKITPNSNKILNLVIGNEACDLDTAVCTITYAYYLSKVRNIEALPVFNLESKNFKLKTESKFLFEKIGLEKDDLIFVDDFKTKTLEGDHINPLSLYLVDCNVYSGGLKKQNKSIVSITNIIDHHKNQSTFSTIEELLASLPDKENSEISFGLGSCSTIICEMFLKNSDIFSSGAEDENSEDENSFNQILKLLYSAVELDTTNFNPNVGLLLGELCEGTFKISAAKNLCSFLTITRIFSFFLLKMLNFQRLRSNHHVVKTRFFFQKKLTQKKSNIK